MKLPDRLATCLIPSRQIECLVERIRLGLGHHHGRHEPNSVLLHLDQSFAIEHVAVLDTIDAQFDRGDRRLRRAGVRGHLSSKPMGGVDDRFDFLGRHERFRDIAAGRRNAPGNHDLDPDGPGGNAATDRLDELVGPIVGPPHVVAAVASRDGDRFAGAENTGTDRLALVDGFLECDRGLAPIAGRPDRRHSRE